MINHVILFLIYLVSYFFHWPIIFLMSASAPCPRGTLSSEALFCHYWGSVPSCENRRLVSLHPTWQEMPLDCSSPRSDLIYVLEKYIAWVSLSLVICFSTRVFMSQVSTQNDSYRYLQTSLFSCLGLCLWLLIGSSSPSIQSSPVLIASSTEHSTVSTSLSCTCWLSLAHACLPWLDSSPQALSTPGAGLAVHADQLHRHLLACYLWVPVWSWGWLPTQPIALHVPQVSDFADCWRLRQSCLV